MPRRYLNRIHPAAAAGCLLVFTAILAGASSCIAQGSSPFIASPDRPGPTIRQTPPQVLEGSALRLSHYNPEQKLRLALAIQRPHEAEEEQFLKELTDPTSPNFHRFLSAEEWNARFSPSTEDEQKVVDWATKAGLAVTNRYANRLLVDVEAPAGAIERAFGVTIDNYQVGEEVEFSNDRDPTIDPSLQGIVTAVLGLNNIQRMHGSMAGAHEPRLPDYAPGPVFSESGSDHGDGRPGAADRARDEMSSNAGPTGPNMTNDFIDPADIYSSQTYDYLGLWQLGHCCNPHNDSAGSPPESSIAIAAWGTFEKDDIRGFGDKFGLSWNWNSYAIDGNPTCPKGQTTCPSDETTLDTEYSTAMSNSFGNSNTTAHVYVYVAGQWGEAPNSDVYNHMLEDGHARVFTTSWSCTENAGCSSTAIKAWHGIFNSMLGQGWTLMSASGDRGASDDCSWNKTAKDYNGTPTTSVSYPASDPDVIGVGGTELSVYTDGTFDSETAWQGGTSWGSCGANNGGSGGGKSAIFSMPSYQSSNGLSGSKRQVPDIALNSGGVGQNYYFQGKLSPVGGTSIASPELAGFFAQENAYLLSIGSICGSQADSACAPIGDPHLFLYWAEHARNEYHDPFYDITSGCNSNDATDKYNLKYFCAGKGYDMVTGLGAANMMQLAWALNWELIGGNDPGIPAITWNGPQTNKWYNTPQTVSWTVNDFTGSKNPGTGIAGFTAAWDQIESDPTSRPHGGSGNLFYSGPSVTNSSTGCLALGGSGCLSNGGQGCHTAHVHGWNNEGWTTAGQADFPETFGPVCYDSVPPVAEYTTSPPLPSSGWFNAPVTITLIAHDPGGNDASGVQGIYYNVNGVPCDRPKIWCTYTKPLTIDYQGLTTINVLAVDNAGNSTTSTAGARIDTTPPVTTYKLMGTRVGKIYESFVTVHFTATDNLSGVARTYVSLNNGPLYVLSSNSLPVTLLGKQTVEFFSVDVAGNGEAHHTITFTIQTPTTTALTASPTNASAGQNVTLKAHVILQLSGSCTDCHPGRVTFKDGSNVLGSANVEDGWAKITVSTLKSGTHEITASYGGNAGELPSESSKVTVVVQ